MKDNWLCQLTPSEGASERDGPAVPWGHAAALGSGKGPGAKAKPGGGGPATSRALREELWQRELTFRTERAEGRARRLQPWGLLGHRRLSKMTRRTSPATALGGDGSMSPALGTRWLRGAPSVPDRIPGVMVAGDSLVARGGICTA